MKKYIIALLVIFSLNIYAQKVEIIEDEFKGTKRYQTKHIDLSLDPYLQARVLILPEKNDIIIQVAFMAYSFFTVSDDSKIIFKFDDDSTLDLYFDKSISYKGAAFGYTGSGMEGIRAFTLPYKQSELKLLTMVRVEIDGGYRNIKIKPNAAKKLIESFNNIKNIKKELEKNNNQQ